MAQYFFIPTDNKAYKVVTEKEDVTWAYHVQIKMNPNSGAFIHSRGRDALGNPAQAAKIIAAMGGLPSTEAKYIAMLKDYFAADKKVREFFIKSYNL